MYADIDMENAHPVLMLQYLEKHRYEAPKLRKYVQNRPETINKISADLSLSRNQVKEAFLVDQNSGLGISENTGKYKKSYLAATDGKEHPTSTKKRRLSAKLSCTILASTTTCTR